MPITLTGIDSGTAQYGIGSYITLADRTAAGATGDRTNVDNYHNIRYNFQSSEIAGNAPGIEIPIIGNSPSSFPTQAGPLDIINGFTLPAYTSQMEPIFRNLLNDSRELDTTDTGPPSATQTGGRLAELGAFGGITGITTTPTTTLTGFTQPSRPVRLTMTSSAAGTLTLSGTDGNGDPLREQVVFTAGAGLTQTTSRYFASITSVRASVAMALSSMSDTNSTQPFVSEFFGRSDARLLHGIDVYVRKGTVPNTYREVYIDSLSFSISREGAIAYTIGCVGKRPREATFVDGIGTTESTGTGGTDAGFYRESSGTPEFPFVKREAFTGWQGGLFYTDSAGDLQRLPVVDATVTISNNLAFSPTITGRRTPGDSFRNRRTVTLEGTMEYVAEDTQLIEDVLAGEFLTGTYLRLQNASSGSFPSQTRFNFGRLQFTNVPSAPVSEEGLITRPMSMLSVDSADGSRPDIGIRMEVETPLPLTEITL